MISFPLEDNVFRTGIAVAISLPILITYIFHIISKAVKEIQDTMLIYKIKTLLDPNISYTVFKITVCIISSMITWGIFLYGIYVENPAFVFATIGCLIINAVMYPFLSVFDDYN